MIANAVLSMKNATGEAEERHVDLGQSVGGRRGEKACAAALCAEGRREVAKQGAQAQWASDAPYG